MSISTKLIETEIKVNDKSFHIDLELIAETSDASFSHEFGYEIVTEFEVVEANIETVYDSEGEVVTNRETIKQIERNVSIENYNDQFEWSDFE